MRGRIGWLVLILFILGWDIVSAVTNGESLTYTFRRTITDTAWRWPILVVTVLLVAHLFMPPSWRQHDPLDRLYKTVQTKGQAHIVPSSPPAHPRDDDLLPNRPAR